MTKLTSKARRKVAQAPKLRLKKKIVLGKHKAISTLEARCRALIDNMDLSAWMGDKDERTIYANPKFCELMEYSLKELLGKVSYELWTPESAEKVRRINMTDRKKGISSSYEGELITKSGKIIPVLLHGTPLQDGGTVGVIKDLREMHKKEAEIEDLLNRFDFATKGSNDGLWYTEIPVKFLRGKANFRKLRDHHLWYSPRLKEIIGFKKDKDFPDIMSSWIKRIHLDDTKKVLNEIQNGIKDFTKFHVEYRLKHKSGDYLWICTRGEAVLDKTKSKIFIAGALRDITERKESEEALRESEDTYRAIFENTGTATIIAEDDMTISFANTELENMSGYSKEEIINKKKWPDFFAKEDLKKMKRFHIQRRFNPYSVPRNYEAHFVNRDKEVKNVFLTVAMIPGTKKSVASILDITNRKIAENELRASKKLFDDLVQASPIATFVINADHKVIYWNKEMEQITGLKAGEILGTSNHWKPFYTTQRKMITDMMVDGLKMKDILGYYEDMDVEVSTDQKGIVGSVYFVDFCGKKDKWIRVMSRPLRDPNNHIIGAIEMVEDVTEQRAMRQSLENRMREVHVLYQVSTHIRMFRPLKEILHDISNDLVLACDEVKPARACIIFDNKAYTNLKKGEKFLSKIEAPLEVFGQKRGSIELGYVEKINNAESFLLKPEKKIIHIVAETVRKHVRSREIMERYRKLIRKSVVGIFIVQDGVFKFVNPKFARMFKAKEKDIIDLPYEKLISGCKCESKLKKNKLLNSSRCVSKGKRKDGSLMDVTIVTQRIDYRGKDAILGTVQDITRLKEAQERQANFNNELKLEIAKSTKDLERANRRLRSLNELKDEFIAVTSHELRSPLTAIRGYLSFLVDETSLKNIPEESKAYLTRIHDNVELLNNLVNNILDVSRIETGRFELHQKPTDIFALIQNVIRNFDLQAGEKGISVQFENQLDRKSLIIDIDELRIRQVLRNILDNAIKYTPKGKQITVELEVKGIGVQISFTDEGIGISKSQIFDIFDKFKQAKNNKAHSSGGAGLGLFIAKKIIELHGGMIWAESKIHKGTTFKIQLPLD